MYIQLNNLTSLFHYISNEIIQVLLSDKFSYLHEKPNNNDFKRRIPSSLERI